MKAPVCLGLALASLALAGCGQLWIEVLGAEEASETGAGGATTFPASTAGAVGAPGSAGAGTSSSTAGDAGASGSAGAVTPITGGGGISGQSGGTNVSGQSSVGGVAGSSPNAAGAGGSLPSAGGDGGSPSSAGGDGGSPPSAGGDGGSSPTAGGGAGGVLCEPFGEPELLTGINQRRLWRPTPSADGFTLIFADADTLDLYQSTRSDRGTVFSAATPLANVNTSSSDVTPHLTFDGLSLYFATDRPGTLGDRDIMVATRPGLGQDFRDSEFLSGINTSAVENLPCLSNDELTLLFTSDRSGGAGGEDIWMATRATTGEPFTAAVNVVELNTDADDNAPSLSSDNLTVFFGSNRPGGAGRRDIWFATRLHVADPFSAPQNLEEVNQASLDTDPAITADGTELFFSSTRNGDERLWRSTRTCLTP